MKIEFTKNQFRSLLKIAYLGNWLANATRSGRKGDKRIEEFDDIEQYIFSLVKDFKLEGYVEYDDTEKMIFPTGEFEELMDEFVENYDDEIFWEELFYRLSERDFSRAYSEEEIGKMSMLERFDKEEPFREKWDNELNGNGIDRLEIKEVQKSVMSAEERQRCR